MIKFFFVVPRGVSTEWGACCQVVPLAVRPTDVPIAPGPSAPRRTHLGLGSFLGVGLELVIKTYFGWVLICRVISFPHSKFRLGISIGI